MLRREATFFEFMIQFYLLCYLYLQGLFVIRVEGDRSYHLLLKFIHFLKEKETIDMIYVVRATNI